MDGLGDYLYIIGLTGTGAGEEIGAYSVDSSTGALTAVTGSPFVYPMTYVAGDVSGQYLIGTSSSLTDSNLYVFAIQQSGANAGALTQVTGSPFATVNAPYTVAVQPAGGELVYSFSLGNGNGNPIEGYQLNTTTGALSAVSGSPFTSTTEATGGFDQSGDFLFALDGNTLTGYQVSSNGSLTSLASLVEGWGAGIAIADVP